MRAAIFLNGAPDPPDLLRRIADRAELVVAADGGAPRQLSFGSVHDNGPLSWSRDGRSIVFSSNRSPDWASEPIESEVYSLDIASGSIP